MFVSDLITTIESGGLDYSPANRRKILGSLRRCTAIYGEPGNRIPVDPDRFTKRWGKGKVKTYPIEHFATPEQFGDWRSNVRGAMAQATGAKAAGQARRASLDDWAVVLGTFDRVADLLFNVRQRPRLERLADCARRDGIAPDQLTLPHVVRFRSLYCITGSQQTSLVTGARIFDGLQVVPALASLLPADPIGKLPPLRADTTGARLAATSSAFRDAWGACRAAICLGTPSALTGSCKPKSEGHMGQVDAALAWLLESIASFGVDTSAFNDPRDLARPDWIKVAAKSIADAYDEDGDPLDEDVAPRLSLGSLQAYLQKLGTIFATLRCDIATATIAELLGDDAFKGIDGMTPENIEFCKTLVRSPAKQALLFGMPWAMQARAQALLDRGWDTLNDGERQAAIRAGACAAAMLILIRCAPIRIGNLAAIGYKGRKRWLSAPPKGGLALLHIPARYVKSRKEIRADLQNDGKKNSWALISWYLDYIGPASSPIMASPATARRSFPARTAPSARPPCATGSCSRRRPAACRCARTGYGTRSPRSCSTAIPAPSRWWPPCSATGSRRSRSTTHGWTCRRRSPMRRSWSPRPRPSWRGRAVAKSVPPLSQVLARRHWVPCRLDAEDAFADGRVSEAGIRAMDRWLAHLDAGKEVAATAATVLAFFPPTTSPNPISKLAGAVHAVSPGDRYLPAISEALRIRSKGYYPKKESRARSVTPTVSVEVDALPAEWRAVIADMRAGVERGSRAPAAAIVDTVEMKLRQLAFSAQQAGLPATVDVLTCHWSFIQPRPEPSGHLRLSARVEQSPGARNFHHVQRDGRLRLSGAGRNLRGSGSQGPNGAARCCSR